MGFEVLEKSREIVRQVYSISLPNHELYNLTSQIRRASISIPLNISEGNAFRDKRRITHFERALGSLNEVEECLILIKQIYPESYREVELIEAKKMLKSLIFNLKSKL